MRFISLGSDCSIRYHIEENGLVECSYPFDWVQTPTADCILKMLYGNFLENYKIKSKSQNFPKIDENWDDTRTATIRVVDLDTNITYVHDFVSPDDILSVREKYIRRLDRFKTDMLNPELEKILFRISNLDETAYLTSEFKKIGFTNFKIIPLSFKTVTGKCWKKLDYDWTGLFNSFTKTNIV
jgi:hypothetical protein